MEAACVVIPHTVILHKVTEMIIVLPKNDNFTALGFKDFNNNNCDIGPPAPNPELS